MSESFVEGLDAYSVDSDEEQVVVQLPIGLLAYLAEDQRCRLDVNGSGSIDLSSLGAEWAVVYYEKGIDTESESGSLGVASFDDRESAAGWLAENYNNGYEIVAVLNRGRQRKFDIQINAKIRMR